MRTFSQDVAVRKNFGFMTALALLFSFFIALAPATEASAANGGSASFNGSSSYFNAGTSNDWNIGTGDFTVEWFQKPNAQTSAWPRVFGIGTYPNTSLGVSIEYGTMYVWVSSSWRIAYNLGAYEGVWDHFAITRTGGTLRLWRNGNEVSNTANSTSISPGATCPLSIGAELDCGSNSLSNTYFNGLLTNFRFVKGTAVYTSSFSKPSAPLSSVTNTKLLMLSASSGALATDSSGLNRSVSNVNSVGYSTSNPFEVTVPGAPTLNSATATNGGANLSWSAPSDNGNSAITAYQYQLDGGAWVATGSTSTSFSLTGLTAGQSYSVAVRALNAIGSSVASNSRSFTPTKPTQTVTWSPTNTTATVASGSLTPSTMASTNGDGAITYSVSSAGTTGCTVNSATAVLTYSAAGTCTVLATAATTTAYNAGTRSVSFVINKSNPTITWTPANTSATVLAATLTPASLATTTSNGAVTYSVSNAGTTGCTVNSATADINYTAAGTCVILATAASTAAYNVATTSVSFIISRTPQTVSWSPTTAHYLNASPVTPSVAASALGGATVTYSVQSAGATGCTVSNASTGAFSFTAAGTCVIRATAAATTAYETGYVDVPFVISAIAQYSVVYDYHLASAGASTASETFSTGSAALVLPTPTRTSYVFTGWYTAATGGTKVGDAGAAFTPSANVTLHARWVQVSLYGMGAANKIGTITTVAGLGNTYSVSSQSTSVQVQYAADSLPAGTVIDIYLLSDTTRAQQMITATNAFIVNLVIAWKALDETVPSTAPGSPISMTISNPAIKAGATVFGLLGSEVTTLGVATQDGTITVAITDDPEIVVASVKPQAPQSVSAVAANGSVTVNWAAPNSNGGSTITGYVVTANTGQTCSTTGALTCQISGLTNGMSYTFTVVANNAIGASAVSQSAAATPLDPATVVVTPPSVPPVPPVVVNPDAPVEPSIPVALPQPSQGAVAVIDGVATEVKVTKSVDGKSVSIAVKDVQLEMSGSIQSSQAAGSNLGFNSKAGASVALAGGGVLANSNMKVFALVAGKPIELSALKADANGKFAVSVGLKSSLPSGTHTLQIAAIAPDGSPVTISQVLTVLPTFTVVKARSAYFESGSVQLSAAAKKQLAIKAASLANRKNITVTVTGFVSASNFKPVYANTAKARAKAVVSFLKTKKVIGKFVVKWAKSSADGPQAMRADITVKSSN